MINTGNGSKISCKWLVGGTYIPHHFRVHFKLFFQVHVRLTCVRMAPNELTFHGEVIN